MKLAQRIYSAFPYWGGKYYAVPALVDLIPERISDVASPFLGGANLEINLANHNDGLGTPLAKVSGNDLFRPLANFWQNITGMDYMELIQLILDTMPENKEAWLELKKKLDPEGEDLETPAQFYNIVTHSYAGTGASGGGYFKKPKRDYIAAAKKLERFAGMPLYCCDFDYTDFLQVSKKQAQAPTSLLFADPPYAKAEAMYGQKRGQGIDHKILREATREWTNWIVTVDATEEIRALYRGCAFMRFQHFNPGYSVRHGSRHIATDVAIVSDAVEASKPRLFPLERFK